MKFKLKKPSKVIQRILNVIRDRIIKVSKNGGSLFLEIGTTIL